MLSSRSIWDGRCTKNKNGDFIRAVTYGSLSFYIGTVALPFTSPTPPPRRPRQRTYFKFGDTFAEILKLKGRHTLP